MRQGADWTIALQPGKKERCNRVRDAGVKRLFARVEKPASAFLVFNDLGAIFLGAMC
jgi:hypothetical protein